MLNAIYCTPFRVSVRLHVRYIHGYYDRVLVKDSQVVYNAVLVKINQVLLLLLLLLLLLYHGKHLSEIIQIWTIFSL